MRGDLFNALAHAEIVGHPRDKPEEVDRDGGAQGFQFPVGLFEEGADDLKTVLVF